MFWCIPPKPDWVDTVQVSFWQLVPHSFKPSSSLAQVCSRCNRRNMRIVESNRRNARLAQKRSTDAI